jgi:fucose permease
MGHAHIHEVMDSRLYGNRDRFARRSQVDLAEFARLRGRWMRRADEMHEGVFGTDVRHEGTAFEHVASHPTASRRQTTLRAGPNQGAHAMPSLEQNGDEMSTEVPGAARHEYVAHAVFPCRAEAHSAKADLANSLCTVRLRLAVLAGVAFISLGLPDGLLGVAWPSMRLFFGLDIEAVGALLVATMCGYVASSFSSGSLLRRLNVGSVLALSCALTACGLLGYATTSQWPLMVALGVALGVGGGAIDSALNTYAATHHGARTLNWLHACYGLGAATGPLIMTVVLGAGLGWQRGYAMVGLAQLALAACFGATVRWWESTEIAGSAPIPPPFATIPATLRLAGARLGIAAFFVYAGVEASAGVWTYTLLTEARGADPVNAARAVSLFWGGLTGGRLLAAFAGTRVPPRRMLWAALWGVTLGTMLMWGDISQGLTYAGVLLAGWACGPIFPTLVAITPARLGAEHAANAVGFQIASAALGLSILPSLVGVAAGAFGIEVIATLLVAMAVLLMLVYRLLERVSITSSKPTDAGLPSARDFRKATRSSSR